MPYLDFAHLEPTPVSTLERARDIGRGAGLDFIYVGNVSIKGGEDTVCPQCGTLNVARMGFSADVRAVMESGHCSNCGTDLNIRREHCG
jgi:pyruvate formate lyase activating enzyme